MTLSYLNHREKWDFTSKYRYIDFGNHYGYDNGYHLQLPFGLLCYEITI